MIIICIFPISFLSLLVNPDEKSYIISNNSILLGKHDSERKKLSLISSFLLLFIKLTHHEGIASSSFISF